MTVAIETHNLRKAYGRTIAVADLSLKVGRGEVFGFLGPNGAGKTTSVKMLLGLVRPTSGSADLLGKPLGDRSTRARIGFLPEHFRFYPWLQAAEFLDLQGQLYGMPADQRRTVVPQILRRVGLGAQEQTRLAAFSKGMTQRIGLAQALMNEPDLVFLDEPTSGLDPLGRKLVRDIMNELRARGTTVFLNSHMLSEVEQTCDRVAFIKDGTVLESHDLDRFDDEAIEVCVRVGAPDEVLLTALRGRAADVRLSHTGAIQLRLAHEREIPDLVDWLVAEGHAVYALVPQRLSLEDRFLRVIGEHSGDVNTPAEGA